MVDRTRIKICGMRTDDDIQAAVAAGADAVGFIFVEDSPRAIDPDDAANLVCTLPPFVAPVGVFVDRPSADVLAMALDACVEIVQLHGHESMRDVEAIQTEFAVMRGVQFGTSVYQQWKSDPLIDLLLVDGSSGGEGEAVCWSALSQERGDFRAPLVLAGGLTPQNVGEAIREVRPFAVDVSSGVESERGRKDPDLIREFCRAVREVDHQLQVES